MLVAVGFGLLLTDCEGGDRRKPQYGQRTIMGGRAEWTTPARVHWDEGMISCSMWMVIEGRLLWVLLQNIYLILEFFFRALTPHTNRTRAGVYSFA